MIGIQIGRSRWCIVGISNFNKFKDHGLPQGLIKLLNPFHEPWLIFTISGHLFTWIPDLEDSLFI